MAKQWGRVFRALAPVVVALGPGWGPCAAEDLSKAPLPEGLVARDTVATPAAVV
jgi:hypothetical protein